MTHGDPVSAASQRPLVSILIPCYNHERYIEHCLDSVLADGYENLELHLIDDGSSDRSFEIAQQWQARHSHRFAGGVHLERQTNQGLIRTLNRLLERAQGEFVAMLASDDALLEGGLAARVDYLRSHPHYLAVTGDAVGIDENGARTMNSVIRERHRGDPGTLACDAARSMELILNWSMPGPVYLARRSIIDAVGLYDERFFVEDRQYFLRILALDALGFIERPVAEYRMHSHSQGGSPSNRTRMAVELARIDSDARRHFSGWRRAALSLRLASYLPHWREVARIAGPRGWPRVIMAYPARILVLVWRDLNRVAARLQP